MFNKIKIHEVGLRDGLQNEKSVVPTDIKIQWINKIIESKVDIIQIGSFVHPAKMPQMADTDNLFEYFTAIQDKPILSGLALNEKGVERALKCGAEMICLGASASNTHSLKNTGMSSDEAVKRIINVAKEVQNTDKKVQVSIQSAFGCGYEGKVPEDLVLSIATQYIDNGLYNISLADTSGYAYPEQIKRMFESIKNIEPRTNLTAHFHNTYGLGIANCYAAMGSGAEYFETAFGGLGGCPFTKLAAGNVSTEDLIYALQRNNVRKDINISKIIEVAKLSSEFLGKESQSYLSKIEKINTEL